MAFARVWHDTAEMYGDVLSCNLVGLASYLADHPSLLKLSCTSGNFLQL